MTIKGEHTPGPWEVGDLDHAGQRIVRQQHIEICTCWHHSVTSIEREMEANARLIAAAPELLEALDLCQSALAMMIAPDAIKNSTVLNAFAQATEAEAKARAALAKAGAR